MATFVDEAQLHAKGGDGGAGAVSFRREAHVDKGGPDGGDGGRGGAVWLVADRSQASLLSFRDHPFRRGDNGSHGSSKRKHGASGSDLIVKVPEGTVVRSLEGEIVCDLTSHGHRWMAARGGQGGNGNAKFLSNSRRAPAFAEQGETGEETWFDLELKLLADVALVGLPNVGKSTLIASISAAKPKIADYPFTTLVPNLGVVRAGGAAARRRDDAVEFVVADIPGLIEGASEGKGLGHQFLRHIERARVLVVLVDLAHPEQMPWQDQEATLLSELEHYQPELIDRPRILVGSRADLNLEQVPEGLDLVISSVTREGLDELVSRLAVKVVEAREIVAVERADSDVEVIHQPLPDEVSVDRALDGSWIVSGRPAERAVALSDLTGDDALAEAVRRLDRLGIDRMLRRAGAKDGDEVQIGKFGFTWYSSSSGFNYESGAGDDRRPAAQRRSNR
ncbi:MAG: GTPase ObgE [Actinomycetes bacterium]